MLLFQLHVGWQYLAWPVGDESRSPVPTRLTMSILELARDCTIKDIVYGFCTQSRGSVEFICSHHAGVVGTYLHHEATPATR